MSAAALVLVTTSFPLRGDGREAAGSFVADLAMELARDQPVSVVAPGGRTCEELWSDHLRVFRYAAPERPLSTLKPWRPGDLAVVRAVLREGWQAMRAAMQAGPVQRVIALWALPSGHWARRASREFSVPYDVWTLGSDIWSLGRIPLVRVYLRTVLRDAERCYSDGLALARDTAAIAGRAVKFLPSTRRIEGSRVRPPKAEPPYRLLFIGRWHRNKGVDLLLDALLALDDDDWERIAVVEVYGGGPLEDDVRDRIGTLELRGRPVLLGGFVTKAEAESLILGADWLLIPSRIESIPLVFSDAVKLGCPVVATPVGDLPELVTGAGGVGACGVLAPAVSAAGIATAMREALGRNPGDFATGVAAQAMSFSLPQVARVLASGTAERGQSIRLTGRAPDRGESRTVDENPRRSDRA